MQTYQDFQNKIDELNVVCKMLDVDIFVKDYKGFVDLLNIYLNGELMFHTEREISEEDYKLLCEKLAKIIWEK